eukprot:CAMPEP_0117588530 /NCGR_PEP_ID=MMETSP0784-20121206/69905_1 /TAXON_ID=39447 /ORGANISM="" /LENGTH=218 /DNA_ID=CAMNT_0005389905 /DNA_START=1 /DNA_END=653 /DNA_ORIENTATION=+
MATDVPRHGADTHLDEILTRIYRAEVPGGMKKALAYKALELSFRASHQASTDSLTAFEQAMVAIRSHADERLSPAQAVHWLRRRGASRLASRLRSASCRRNACAHPDPSFLDELNTFLTDNGGIHSDADASLTTTAAPDSADIDSALGAADNEISASDTTNVQAPELFNLFDADVGSPPASLDTTHVQAPELFNLFDTDDVSPPVSSSPGTSSSPPSR